MLFQEKTVTIGNMFGGEMNTGRSGKVPAG